MPLWKVSFRSTGAKLLSKDKASFRNPPNATCIDFIITSRPKFFEEVIETALPDFHKMSLTVKMFSLINKDQKSSRIESIKSFPMKFSCMN